MRRLIALFVLVPAVALAGEVGVKEITATSVQKPEVGGVNYEPENMTKATGFSYWAEGDGSAGLGTRIDVKFSGTSELTGFALWNGSQSDRPTWQNSNRIKTLEFEFKAGTFGDAVRETVELKDEKMRTVYTFKEPRKADQLKMYVRAVYEGAAYNETAVSFIQFLTPGGDGRVYALGATTDSAADGYPAEAAVDGLIDTPWCVQEGKGKGVALEIKLPAGSKLTAIEGFFGINIDGEWEKNARPKSVKVEWGGKSFDWALEDTQAAQKLELGALEGETLRVELGTIKDGRIYKDACISELRFETQ